MQRSTVTAASPSKEIMKWIKPSRYTEAIRIDPKYADAFYNRARSRSRPQAGLTRRLPIVVRQFVFAATAGRITHRGSAYWQKQEYNKAVADDTEAIRLKPGSADAYNNRGTAYLMKKDYDRAIADFTKAVELNPKYFRAFSNRSVAYEEKGEFRKADDDAKRHDKLKGIRKLCWSTEA